MFGKIVEEDEHFYDKDAHKVDKFQWKYYSFQLFTRSKGKYYRTLQQSTLISVTRLGTFNKTSDFSSWLDRWDSNGQPSPKPSDSRELNIWSKIGSILWSKLGKIEIEKPSLLNKSPKSLSPYSKKRLLKAYIYRNLKSHSCLATIQKRHSFKRHQKRISTAKPNTNRLALKHLTVNRRLGLKITSN